ncbi:MAG: methionyl-tRNA formyltransferase [Oscillibacter sp.]
MENKSMRVLFMGTPEFAVASLKRLLADGHSVCGVFTQPDKPKNRGMKLTVSPVKEYALSQGLTVYQPLKMRDGEALGIVETLRPELIVVAAYGKILPEEILNAPQYGSINVHSSLLPKYRGAAPINWAILDGETETGVSIMYMAKELDAGDVILQKVTPIDPEEDAPALTARLAALGAEALSEAVSALRAGSATRTQQDESRQTYAAMLSRELSPIDWTRSSLSIHNQVRGLLPWPCATAELDGKRFKIFKTVPGQETNAVPGSVLSAGKAGIELACGDGRSLLIMELQAEGGKRLSADDYLRGHPIPLG